MGLAKDLVVVKLGGSVITNKKAPMSFRGGAVARLARELRDYLPKPMVIVHGGGSYGHPIVMSYRLHEGYRKPEQLEGFVRTVSAMRELNSKVVAKLNEGGIPAFGIPSSSVIVAKESRISSFSMETMLSAMERGLVPVLNGDVVIDRKMGFCVVSGDQIACYLAIRLRAKRLVFAVDVDGVYAEVPGSKERFLVHEIDSNSYDRISYAKVEGDVTGGMIAKVEEACKVAEEGIDVILINGLVKGRVRKAVMGEDVKGTKVVCRI